MTPSITTRQATFRQILTLGLTLLLSSSPVQAGLGILMPVYTEDPAQFAAAYAAVDKVPFIAVINPSDGPGAAPVAELQTFVNTIKAKGGQVAGYINSTYGSLSVAVGGACDAQMDLYASFYGVNAFFVDEVEDLPAYYNSMAALDATRYLILNPGTNISAGNNTAARIIVTYENPLEGDQSLPFLSYLNDLRTSTVASGAIIYNTSTQAVMRSCVDRALAQGYDWLYVTNDINPNPFDGIPSFWTDEINYIASKNGPVLPPALPSSQFKLAKPVAAAGGGWTLTFPTAIGRTYEVRVSTNLQTWTTALNQTGGTPAKLVATTNSLTLTVRSPVGAKKAYYRAADVTP